MTLYIFQKTIMQHKTFSTVFIYYLLTIHALDGQQFIQEDHIHILKKRAILQSVSETFHVSEMTFACNQTQDVITQQEIRRLLNLTQIQVRRVKTLAEDDMQYLLQYKGGTFIPEYLKGKKAQFDFPDAKIMRFRRNFARIYPGNEMSNAANGRLRSSERRRLSPGLRPGSGKDSGLGTSPGKIHGFMPGSKPSENHQPHSKGPPRGQKKGPTLSGRKKGNPHKRRRRRQAGLSLFPTTTQATLRLAENCSDAGEPSEYDPNYLHLCKICSSQRVLPENFYPQLLNEVYCQPSDNGCLSNNDGKCAPTIFNVHILKRREDICRLCVKDREPLAVNEWEIYPEAINVGCECMLNKNSDYRSRWFGNGGNTPQTYSVGAIGKK